jgi:hypothetical protein
MNFSFMVEKPAGINPIEVEGLIAKVKQYEERANPVRAHVVCNYKFLLEAVQRQQRIRGHFISYDYFHSGSDKVEFNCCQLIYLNPNIDIRNNSPIWTLRFQSENKKKSILVDHYLLEESYISMIRDWLGGGTNCWDLHNALSMQQRISEYTERKVIHL